MDEAIDVPTTCMRRCKRDGVTFKYPCSTYCGWRSLPLKASGPGIGRGVELGMRCQRHMPCRGN